VIADPPFAGADEIALQSTSIYVFDVDDPEVGALIA
jgi:hypothetical protein